ncbi:hypothetical protein CDAR_218601 [Caerostris darwini]|uniref:Uncharacterized protein n=1 Tax=Caerostris darwini TaxID=1538125 RepID=A0AAV4VCG5_9ARAC|nr:hypothetical protein CDAR_218601 [Caerostris darwini]
MHSGKRKPSPASRIAGQIRTSASCLCSAVVNGVLVEETLHHSAICFWTKCHFAAYREFNCYLSCRFTSGVHNEFENVGKYQPFELDLTGYACMNYICKWRKKK